MKKSIIYILFSSLVFLNLLLILKISNSNEIKDYDSFIYSEISKIDVQYLDYDFNAITLVVFIDQISCIDCVKEEIIQLNKLYKDYDQNILVVFFGVDENYLEKLGANFNYLTFRENSLFFGESLNIMNPYSILTDGNLVFHKRFVNTGKPFNKELTASYYSFVQSFLESRDN